jgi:hypothetical protein
MPLLTTQSARGYGLGSLVSPIADNSYESIASVLTSSSTSEINFSSIPSTYAHLQIRMYTIADTAQNVHMQFNGDTTSAYYWHEIFGDTSTALSGWSSGAVNHIKTGYTHDTASNRSGQSIVTILDYASTSKKKTANALTGSNSNSSPSSGYVLNRSGHWTSTAAISSLRLVMSSGNLRAGSRISLYGIKG